MSNEWLEQLAPWIFLLGANSLKAVPLILLLAALQKWARYWITPRGMRALWFLAVARLFMPEIVFTPASIYTLPAMIPAGIVQKVESIGMPTTTTISAAVGKSIEALETTPVSTVTSAPAKTFRWKPAEAIAGIWLLGVIGMIGILSIQSLRFHRRFAGLRPSTDSVLLELLEDCKEQAGVKTPISLIVSESIAAPAIYGFLRPRLLLPAALVRSLSREQLRCIFQHEVAHVSGWDIAVNWLVMLTVMLHWFNPFVWFMARNMAHIREMACDQTVVTHRNDPQTYGEVILRVAESLTLPQVVAGVAGIVENKNAMKERIKMLTRTYGKRGWITALGMACILGALFLSSPRSLRADPASGMTKSSDTGNTLKTTNSSNSVDYAALGAKIRADRRAALEDAQKAAEAWLSIIDSGKYDDCPAPQYLGPDKTTQKDFVNYLVKNIAPLGKLQERYLGSRDFLENGVEEIKVPCVEIRETSTYKSEDGANKLYADLRLTQDKEGKWQVVHYWIGEVDPMDLTSIPSVSTPAKTIPVTSALPGSFLKMEDAIAHADSISEGEMESTTLPTSLLSGLNGYNGARGVNGADDEAKINLKKALTGKETGLVTASIKIVSYRTNPSFITELPPEKGKDYLFFISIDPGSQKKTVLKVLPADEQTLSAVTSAIAASHIDYAALGAAQRATRRAALTDAPKVAETFLAGIHAGKYGESSPPRILVKASGALSPTQKEWTDYLMKTYAPLGQFQSCISKTKNYEANFDVSYNVSGANGSQVNIHLQGPGISLRYFSVYKNEDGNVWVTEELMLMLDQNSSWRVMKYEINGISGPGSVELSPNQ